LATFQHFFLLLIIIFSVLGRQTGLNYGQFSLRIFSIRYRVCMPTRACVIWRNKELPTFVVNRKSRQHCKLLLFKDINLFLRSRPAENSSWIGFTEWNRSGLNNLLQIRHGAEFFLARNRKWNGSDIFDKMLFEFEKNSLK